LPQDAAGFEADCIESINAAAWVGFHLRASCSMRYIWLQLGSCGAWIVKFRVELVWRDGADSASSIFLTPDGRIVLQGRAVSADERKALDLPQEGAMISVDKSLIRAIKDML
jgi:hypothetical protein